MKLDGDATSYDNLLLLLIELVFALSRLARMLLLLFVLMLLLEVRIGESWG